METMITEWNTIIRLKDNLWLKIEEPRKKKNATECSVTVHYSNPNIGDSDGDKPEVQDSLDIDYDYYQEQYDDEQEDEDDD